MIDNYCVDGLGNVLIELVEYNIKETFWKYNND